MAAYFASDVHLRLDRPDRTGRFAHWVDGLPGDSDLYLVGDLCDFWFASRDLPGDPRSCDGLRALIDFRDRGGSIVALPGNHDTWLGPFYRDQLGARFMDAGRLDLTLYGLRLHLVHGHKLGARKAWKAAMESRMFLRAFSALPSPVAGTLDALLYRSNEATRHRSEERHIATYRAYADRLAGRRDLVIIGHTHRAVDDSRRAPRMIVLGDWTAGWSFLKVDESGASHHVYPSPLAEAPTPG